jgi:flagellar basal-body rod protein FlgF
MIYGLWLSATGVTTNSHQVDVIANNLANAETSGFKRQLATFQERDPESKVRPDIKGGDRLFDNLGGGQLLSPSSFDTSAGQLQQTGRNLDVAVAGDGYFMVQDAQGQQRLTRNGNFMADRDGNLVMAIDSKTRVLDANKQPIKFDPEVNTGNIEIGNDGSIEHAGQVLNKIGVFNVADEKLLRPVGGTLLKAPASVEVKQVEGGQMESGYLEGSNVDPATELTKLMEAQRMLDANANLIRTQDQSMSRLVNDVGRIS